MGQVFYTDGSPSREVTDDDPDVMPLLEARRALLVKRLSRGPRDGRKGRTFRTEVQSELYEIETTMRVLRNLSGCRL